SERDASARSEARTGYGEAQGVFGLGARAMVDRHDDRPRVDGLAVLIQLRHVEDRIESEDRSGGTAVVVPESYPHDAERTVISLVFAAPDATEGVGRRPDRVALRIAGDEQIDRVGIFRSGETLHLRPSSDDRTAENAAIERNELDRAAAIAGVEADHVEIVDLVNDALFGRDARMLSDGARKELRIGTPRPFDSLEIVERDHPRRQRIVGIEGWSADLSRANQPAVCGALCVGNDRTLPEGGRCCENENGGNGRVAQSHHSPPHFRKPDYSERLIIGS